jgi:competence protein ComEA
MKRLTLALLPMLFVPVLYAQDLPDGAGKDTLQKTCTTCHDLSAVTSMNGSAEIWQSVIDDMKSRGADATDDEFKGIVQYLAKFYGPPVHINTDAAKDLQTNLGITDADAAAIVKYRTDNGTFKEWADIAKVPGFDASKIAGLKQRIKY